MRRALNSNVQLQDLRCLCALLAALGCAEGSNAVDEQPVEQDAGPTARPDARVRSDATIQQDAKAPHDFGSDARAFPEATFVGSEATVTDSNLGSLTTQLVAGVRYLQFPIHDDDFRTRDDFGLGVEAPRNGLNFGGGNPTRENLRDWLALVAAWSDAYTGHAPITLTLELRDPISDNTSFDEGDLTRLNQTLRDTLGDKLFKPSTVEDGDWPSVDALRGKVIVVLGGDEPSRARYRETLGNRPAIAGDATGQVLVVHEQTASLRYWLGVRQEAEVQWLRSGVLPQKFTKPAVAMNDSGLVVMVATDSSTGGLPVLSLTIGEMLPGGGTFWRDSQTFAPGDEALVRFVDSSSSTVEIVVDPNTDHAQRYEVMVRRNDGTTVVTETPNTPPTTWERDTVRAQTGETIHVLSDASGVLRYQTDARRRSIAPEQLAFTDYAKGDQAALQRWVRYSEDVEEVKFWLEQGLVVRSPLSDELMKLERLPTIIVDADPLADTLAPYLEPVVEEASGQ